MLKLYKCVNVCDYEIDKSRTVNAAKKSKNKRLRCGVFKGSDKKFMKGFICCEA
jgi:hypothetical protein